MVLLLSLLSLMLRLLQRCGEETRTIPRILQLRTNWCPPFLFPIFALFSCSPPSPCLPSSPPSCSPPSSFPLPQHSPQSSSIVHNWTELAFNASHLMSLLIVALIFLSASPFSPSPSLPASEVLHNMSPTLQII